MPETTIETRLRRLQREAWLFRLLFAGAIAVLFLRSPTGPLVVADGPHRAELSARGLTVTQAGETVVDLGPNELQLGAGVQLGEKGLRLVGGGGTVNLGIAADGPHLALLDRDNGQLDLAAAFLRFLCDGEVRLNTRRGNPIGLTVDTGETKDHFPR